MFGYLQVISKTCCFPSLLYLGWSRVFCVLDIERERELQWGCPPSISCCINHFITLHIIISIYHRPWLLDFFGVVNHLSYRLGVPLCEMCGSTACDSWLCWVDRLIFQKDVFFPLCPEWYRAHSCAFSICSHPICFWRGYIICPHLVGSNTMKACLLMFATYPEKHFPHHLTKLRQVHEAFALRTMNPVLESSRGQFVSAKYGKDRLEMVGS